MGFDLLDRDAYWAELARLRQELHSTLQTPAVRSGQQARTAEKTSAGVEQDPPMPAPPALSVVEGGEGGSQSGEAPVATTLPSTNPWPPPGYVLLGGQIAKEREVPNLRSPNPYVPQIAEAQKLVTNLTNLAISWNRDHPRTRPDTSQGAWD